MSIQKKLKEIKNVQSTLLQFLKDEVNAEESFHMLCSILNNLIIHDKNDLRLFLRLISKISKNYHDGPDFTNKILQILEYLKESIKKNLSNSEIFNVFKKNKRILLFLAEKKIIIFNENIIKTIIQPKYLEANYPQYFQPEIKPFMNKEWFPKYKTGSFNNSNENKLVKELEKKLPDNFKEMRKLGENESYICKLIRNDSVEEFIAHINRNNIPLNFVIKSSIFETNSFLIKKQIESDKSIKNSSFNTQDDKDDKLTLIKYAAFFGSNQIFKYLQINGVKLTPQLWYFAIHGKNAEIIYLLENNHIKLKNLYEECFKEATKCHHNDIANYFLNNYLQINAKSIKNSLIQCLKYYNFHFLRNELIDENTFAYMCQYDYYYFTFVLLNNTNIDVNRIIIESF